tara:strand:+ start:895 stop:2535 length:1641 start_codon:yes stop_codon:yes gene_type:complete
MDEEQGLQSPIAGSLRGIRRSVSSNVFTGRAVPPPVAQPDPQTTSLISQNTLALNTISGQLSNISDSVRNLNGSLGALRTNLELSDSLDRQREAAKQRREAILAEQGLREGKESELENKIQNALLSPVRKIAEKAQGFLSRLANFFFILLGGWLANTTIEFLKLLSGKNIEKFNEFKAKLGKDLLAIGAIILIGGVGIKKLISLTGVLAANALRVTSNALIKAPFLLMLKFFQNLVVRGRNALLKSMGLIAEKGAKTGIIGKAVKTVGKVLSPLSFLNPFRNTGNVTGDVVKEGAKTGNRFTRFLGNLNPFKSKVTGEIAEEGTKKVTQAAGKGFFRKMFTPALNFFLDLNFGESIERAFAGAIGFSAASSLVAKRLKFLRNQGIAGKLAYFALTVGSGFLGEQQAKNLVDGIGGLFNVKPSGEGETQGSGNEMSGSTVNTSNLEASGFDDEDTGVNVSGIQVGGAELIKAANNNKNMVGEKISSLEDPAPNVLTVPISGTNIPMGAGASGSSSSNTPTATIPTINSSDLSNPYVPYSESVYGVHD